MNCEIEFLPVGDKSRAGDAIVVRYGDAAHYEIMVVDGGTADAGEELVRHLRTYFGADVKVEHVVLTHSDADHASGLRELLREIPVSNLWMHIPWLLAPEAMHLFKSKTWTRDGLVAAIREKYEILEEIVSIATEAGTNILYPFRGTKIGPFIVLSPHKSTYLHLLPQFEKTPEADQELIEEAELWIGKAQARPFEKFFAALSEKVQSWTQETWEIERLKDGGVTSASNESSVVLYGNFGENRKVLLTGDAGVDALTWSANYAEWVGLPLQQFSFVQIPHHGSRRNVGPTVLNRLLGPIQPQGTNKFSAFVSAPAEDDNHPRKIVLNAFMRRGGKVIATQGGKKIYWGGFPTRADYSVVEPMPFSTTVEEYDV